MGNLHASGLADITVASVQSITSGDRISKFDPARFKLLLVDEAHHIAASSYMETVRHFGLASPNQQNCTPALVGVSATMSRFDGVRLSDAIDHIVYHKWVCLAAMGVDTQLRSHRDYVDMIQDKWLSHVIFTTVQSHANISRVKKGPTGDFQTGDLSKAVNTDETNEITVRAWLSKAANRKSTLVFCVDLAHVTGLTATFRAYGVDARFITGETRRVVRGERLDAFKERKFPVLLNCGVFTEGTDIPNIDCVLLARPTKSRNLLVQMIGRGMRLHPGKTDCHVIDMVASLAVGIVTAPTLFGLDPAEIVKEADVTEMKSIRERKELEAFREQQAAGAEIVPLLRPSTQRPQRDISFTDYESVYDLIDDTSAERHIRGISALAWVLVGENRYVLSTQNGDYVTIETPSATDEKGALVLVWYTQKVPPSGPEDVQHRGKSPFMRPRQVAKCETFSDAVRAADTFASSRFPGAFVQHTQAWRKKPATEGQLMLLNKYRDMGNQLTAELISKGKATDMITKIKFGAKGWYGRLEATRKREEKKNEQAKKLAALSEREQVRTGPLVSRSIPPNGRLSDTGPGLFFE